jgi:hypothetical protein
MKHFGEDIKIVPIKPEIEGNMYAVFCPCCGKAYKTGTFFLSSEDEQYVFVHGNLTRCGHCATEGILNPVLLTQGDGDEVVAVEVESTPKVDSNAMEGFLINAEYVVITEVGLEYFTYIQENSHA